MTLEEAKNLVKELERYVNENIPFNSTGKETVEKLYYNVFGKNIYAYIVPAVLSRCVGGNFLLLKKRRNNGRKEELCVKSRGYN